MKCKKCCYVLYSDFGDQTYATSQVSGIFLEKTVAEKHKKELATELEAIINRGEPFEDIAWLSEEQEIVFDKWNEVKNYLGVRIVECELNTIFKL